jgi:hypothetical protein
LRRLKFKLAQPSHKTAIDFVGVRLEQHGQTLQVVAELIAQYIRGIGEFG